MNIFHHINEVKKKGFVATVGIFDGVHRAHQNIISTMNNVMQNSRQESLVITLWPHPRYVLNKNADELELINSIDEKIALLEKSGLKNLLILPFTKEFAALPYDTFFNDYLVDLLGIQTFVVGFNNQFGKNREGNIDKLKDLTTQHGIETIRIEPFFIDNKKVSSSLIRSAIKKGEIHLANRYLGYNFSLKGKVVKGNSLGRKIDFPTANILIEEPFKIIPQSGVYASKVKVGNEFYTGLLNIGVRPTVSEEGKTTIEVHLLNFNKDIYNTEIELFILEKVRSEKKFNNLNELQFQIKNDKTVIQQVIAEKYS